MSAEPVQTNKKVATLWEAAKRTGESLGEKAHGAKYVVLNFKINEDDGSKCMWP